MKKVFGILLLALILSFPSCDFLRKSAGRPTSEELRRKAEAAQLEKEMEILRRQAFEDSLLTVQLELEQDRIRQDSLTAVRYLDSLGVKLSGKFSYGIPQNPPRHRYNLIIGVFRNGNTVNSLIRKATDAGYEAFTFNFDSSVKAVCLAENDDIADMARIVGMAREESFFPNGAWIYEAK